MTPEERLVHNESVILNEVKDLKKEEKSEWVRT